MNLTYRPFSQLPRWWEFIELNDLHLVVEEPAPNEWIAYLDRVGVKGHQFSPYNVVGHGPTPCVAVREYLCKIHEKYLVIDPDTPGKRYVEARFSVEFSDIQEVLERELQKGEV